MRNLIFPGSSAFPLNKCRGVSSRPKAGEEAWNQGTVVSNGRFCRLTRLGRPLASPSHPLPERETDRPARLVPRARRGRKGISGLRSDALPRIGMLARAEALLGRRRLF